MKRNAIRKIVLLSLSLCMASMLAGCGNTASENSTAGKPANSKSSDSKSSEAEKEVEHSVEAQEFNENIIGTADGYGYELWKDKGDTKFFVEPGGGCFSCEWKNINNALFRRGQKFDCTQTYDQLGNISVDYGIDYKPQGNSYMCVYGWTRSPLVEFYIVESWGTWRPPGAPSAIGNVTVDGAVYDIYKTTRVEQPSIDGTQTFDQYWSVRREKPAGEGTKIQGTISVSKHFDAWKKCGLDLGKMYEVALTIEGYQSRGSAVIYKNDLKIEGTYSEATDIEVNVNE